MAARARLNVSLIVVIVLALVGAAALIGGFAYLQIRADASRNVRQGDEFMARGEYQQALSAYGRAVSKEPSNLEYVDKAIDALTHLVPRTRSETVERFGRYIQLVETRVGIAPTRPDTHLPLVEMRHELARLEPNNAQAWANLREAAARMAEQIDPEDPAYPTALTYRAIGDLGRPQLLTRAQFDSAIADLEAVIARRPNDDLASSTLPLALAAEAERLRLADRNDSNAVVLASRAATALRDAVQRVPGGPLVAAAELQDLLQRRQRGELVAARIDEVASRLLDNLSQAQDTWVIDRAITPLLFTGDPKLSKRAAETVRGFLERNPNSLYARQALMACLSVAGEHDAAAKEAEAILSLPPQPVGVQSMLQPEVRVAAATVLFDRKFNEMREAADPAERARLMAGVEEALARLEAERDVPGDDVNVLKSRARLAAAKEDWRSAIASYEKAIRQVGEGGASFDLLYEAALAATKAGDLGAARKRIDQCVDRHPTFLQGVLLKAEVERQLGDMEAARETLAKARTLAPDDSRVATVESALATTPADDDIARQLSAAQERTLAGDLDAAWSMLSAAATRHPDDVRILRAQAHVALLRDDRAAAAEIARKALAKAPNDQFVQRAIVLAETSDPVERTVRTIELDTVEGPDRDARTLQALLRVAAAHRAAADGQERRGDKEAAESTRAVADRLEAEAQRYRERAATQDPPHPVLVQVDFEQALERGDFDAAQALLDRESSRQPQVVTPVERAIMQARLLVERAESEGGAVTARRQLIADAARGVDQALQRNPESTQLRMLLGRIQLLLGNVRAAADSFEMAYAQRPNDMVVVEAYVNALQASGQQARLLQVLREAAAQRDVSPSVRSLWLGVEAIQGSRLTALTKRRELQAAVPDDVANGVQLVALLLSLPPARELIVDRNGRERISEERWRSMSPADQRAALEALRREWFDEAERVLKQLVAAAPNDIEVAAMRADLARVRGKPDEGVAILRDAVKQASGDAKIMQAQLALGSYLANIGRIDAAMEALNEAVKHQGNSRQADRYIALMLTQRGDIAGAVPHLKSVADQSGLLADRLALVEALARSGQIETATQALADVEKEFGADGDVEMMRATLISQQLEAATRAGRTDLAELRQALDQSLARAQSLRPTDPAPLSGQAQVIVASWQRKLDRSPSDPMLDEAIALADKALALRADYWPASRLKSQILNARGDVTRARMEVERILKLTPLNDEARFTLIELWNLSREPAKAIATAREGADLRPLDPRWRRVLGDLLDHNDDLPGAIAAHRQAYELEPGASPDRLVMLMLKRSRNHEPEYEAVARLFQERPELIERSVYLRAASGAALANTGKRAEGLERLKQAYHAYVAQVKDRPDLINGWYDQIWLVFPTDRTADAEQFVRTVVGGELSPFDLREIALRWAEAGASGRSKAVQLLQQAAASSSELAPRLRSMILFDLGNALYLDSQCPQAIQAYEQGVALNPDSPGILNNLAYLYDSCLNDPGRALPFAERAVALAPGEASMRDTLGVVCGKLGQHDRAEAELRASLAIARTPETHVNLARVLADSNRKAEAKVELRKAVDLDQRIRQSEGYKEVEKKASE